MSSHEEIQTTLSRFMNCFDLKDWASMSRLLEPTIRVDYADLRGQVSDVTAAHYVKTRAENLRHLVTQHLLSNFDIATSGDCASVGASCMIYRSNGSKQFNSHAFYTFSLVTRDGLWKISGIRQRILWSEGDPTIHAGAKT